MFGNKNAFVPYNKRQRRNIPLRYHSCSAFWAALDCTVTGANPAQPTHPYGLRCTAQRGYALLLYRRLSPNGGSLRIGKSKHVSSSLLYYFAVGLYPGPKLSAKPVNLGAGSETGCWGSALGATSSAAPTKASRLLAISSATAAVGSVSGSLS